MISAVSAKRQSKNFNVDARDASMNINLGRNRSSLLDASEVILKPMTVFRRKPRRECGTISCGPHFPEFVEHSVTKVKIITYISFIR